MSLPVDNIRFIRFSKRVGKRYKSVNFTNFGSFGILVESGFKQGQTVHMLQLFWIYIPLARLYIYIFI